MLNLRPPTDNFSQRHFVVKLRESPVMMRQCVYHGGALRIEVSTMKNCPRCQSTYPDSYAICPMDSTPLVEFGLWTEGSIIRGKFRIVRKVGQGGMGTVYEALHLRFNERRALKVMSPEVASDPDFVRRFEREAVVTRRLQHPNAVHVDDIEEAEDGR